MKFPQNLLEEIRERIPVSDVVGRKVKLRRQGREYAGLSPFNKEKTPSFFVNDQKQFYHCFSSGKHGDIFKFLMETEGLSFPEAVEALAQQAGVVMPSPDPQMQKRERERASLYDVMEMAAKYFQLQFSADLGREARRYVQGRGLTAETLKTFRFGYSVNSRDHLKSYLLERGISEQDMLETGLIIKPDEGRSTYDRFRNRLMIPIEDEKGRVVAFGGRSLDPDGKPKYLNSPETKLFFKGTMVFNAHRARQAAYEAGAAIVVEGYMDAIALHQAGIRHVVASLGTAFTEQQIARMWRFSNEPYICFDGDRAGRQAAHRSIERILPSLKAGYSFQFVFLPNGKDPDDLVREGGTDAFRTVLGKARPLSDVIWERELEAQPVDTPERKAALEKRIEELLKTIKDERVQRQYQMSFKSALSNLFWQQERQKRDTNRERRYTGGGGKAGQGAGPSSALQASANISRAPEDGRSTEYENCLIGLAIHMPYLFEQFAEQILNLPFQKSSLEAFKFVLSHIIFDKKATTYADIYALCPNDLKGLLDDMHGMEVRNEDGTLVRPWGWRLAGRQRVHQLAYGPSRLFLERLFQSYLNVLEVREVENDLQREMSQLQGAVDEGLFARIQSLTNELHRRREENLREEQELSELYNQMKSAGIGMTLEDVLAQLALPPASS
ncbi:DNA primase [Cohaesibacter celericrescens]|uniref:DNA primase n=1 Tax=Cohaesibacter celericrescens TaxID=2067669 RepID=A0A2N5XX96_9HYPH|nr:DNA primase [Cohaesibacter celericrescens]PLW79109.1 DNA primase [Cohaesibacter celericrescens]